MNNTITPNREAKEINLIDLFWYIFSKWKALIVWAVIGMVLVGGFQTYKTFKNSDDEFIQQETAKHIDNYDDVNLMVNDVAMSQVKNLFSYADRIARIQKHIAVSEKYKIDAEQAYTINMQYNIDNGYVMNYTTDILKDYTDRLCDAYTNLESNEELLTACAEALNLDTSCVEELISISSGRTSDVFNVFVYASTPERTELLADTIDSFIYKISADYSKDIGEHKVSLINRGAKTVVDDGLYNWQMSQLDGIYSYQNMINTTLATFTMGQVLTFEKMIYDKYPDGVEGVNTRPISITEIDPATGTKKAIVPDYELVEKYIEQSGLELEVAQIEKPETEEEEFSITTIIKFALIGFVVGVLVGAVWFACVYIFGKKVKSAEELTGYGLDVLGDTSHAKENNKTAVDRLRYKKAMTLAEAKDLAFVNTKVVLQKKESKQLIVSTMKLQDNMLATVNELITELKANGVDVELADSLNLSGASIEKLASAQSVVFVEQLGILRYDQIEAALTKCVRQSVDVSGVIVF